MPDLGRPVLAVSKAVHNLVKVGREMVQTTDDKVMQQDMPPALNKVETAAKLLEEAASLSQVDPLSKAAREKLIGGSRSILQGTSNVLLVFDESEVRKIIANAKKVLEYLAVAEVIETSDDLITFVKNITPVFSKTTKEVTSRTDDLTHQSHKEMLLRCVEQLNTLCPILICAMRIFIEILAKAGAKGEEEAAENRNYLVLRMTEELHEVIRVLQLTSSSDEDDWNSDNVSVMKKTMGNIEAKTPSALDWLNNPEGMVGAMGEKALGQILEEARKIAERSLPRDGDHLRKLADDTENMAASLAEMRSNGQGTSPGAVALAKSIGERLNEISQTIAVAVDRVDKSGIQRPSATVTGRLEQAKRWLQQPAIDDMGLGQRAITLLVEDGLKISGVLPSPDSDHVRSLSKSVEQIASDLALQVKQGRGHSTPAQAMARTLAEKLDELKSDIQGALVNKVVEDFLDIATPLKKFTDAVDICRADPSTANEENFIEKANVLGTFSAACVATANMVSVGSDTGNKRVAEALQSASMQVESLIPQLIHAGRIKMVYLDNKAADDHFDNLKSQYNDAIQRVRALCDVATDSGAFVERSVEAMAQATKGCELAIQTSNPNKMVEHASKLGRLANRVIHVARQETENSEDPAYIARLNVAVERVHRGVPPMVQSAKSLALDITSPAKVAEWRKYNGALLESVQGVQEAIGSNQAEEQPPLPPYPNLTDLSISGDPPPRPPQPADYGVAGGAGGSMASSSFGGGRGGYGTGADTTDDESEEIFHKAPTPSQGPIMMAAHDLHQEVKQWSSKDNDIIAAAKKMALLMARLSQLVQEDSGSKKDLIACAKAIAESSEDVTRIAKELAKECTDKRMRTALLQVCERIPTIATQLKILSTVKATMLGAQGTEEDQEATEMLVGNAQNLMHSVKQTVTAAEAATIKIRTDAGIRLIWNRKQPWYNY